MPFKALRKGVSVISGNIPDCLDDLKRKGDFTLKVVDSLGDILEEPRSDFVLIKPAILLSPIRREVPKGGEDKVGPCLSSVLDFAFDYGYSASDYAHSWLLLADDDKIGGGPDANDPIALYARNLRTLTDEELKEVRKLHISGISVDGEMIKNRVLQCFFEKRAAVSAVSNTKGSQELLDLISSQKKDYDRMLNNFNQERRKNPHRLLQGVTRKTMALGFARKIRNKV